MKKSHQWDTTEILDARCPYCCRNIELYCFCGDEGDIVECPKCKKTFELGKQK